MKKPEGKFVGGMEDEKQSFEMHRGKGRKGKRGGKRKGRRKGGR